MNAENRRIGAECHRSEVRRRITTAEWSGMNPHQMGYQTASMVHSAASAGDGASTSDV